MKKIARIGLEFEGEWSAQALQRMAAHPAVLALKHDGSIRTCSRPHITSRWLEAREIVTKPLKPDAPELADLFETLQDLHKRHEYHFNTSCGFHVHVSFRDGRRKALPDEAGCGVFAEEFARSIERTFPSVWRRRRNNSYCGVGEAHLIGRQADLRMTSVLHGSHTSRYTFLNHAAWLRHGTLEVRIWPADTPKRMKAYMAHTIGEFNRTLSRQSLTMSAAEDCPTFIERNDELTARQHTDDNGIEYAEMRPSCTYRELAIPPRPRVRAYEERVSAATEATINA